MIYPPRKCVLSQTCFRSLLYLESKHGWYQLIHFFTLMEYYLLRKFLFLPVHNILPAKKYGISEKHKANTHISHFDAVFCHLIWKMKWQDTAPWVTPFCHFVSALKLLSGDWSHFCVMSLTNYQTHTKLPYIHNVIMDILEVVREFSRSIEKLHIPLLYIVYL